MTSITLTKTKLALAITAVALLVPATAWATHTFTDVEDGRFYTDAVEWAFDNDITTGTSETTFSPDDPVTRGQNVTFAKRYDDNIVQPALSEMGDDIDANTAAITNDSAAAFANGDNTEIEVGTSGGSSIQTLTMTAPADGVIIANSFVRLESDTGAGVGCSLADEAGHDGIAQQQASLTDGPGVFANLANTRGFDVTAGEAITIHLFCTQFGIDAMAAQATITAIFTAS